MANMIKTNWGDKYMAGSMPEKFVRMTVISAVPVQDFDWPADPFFQPYMGYFVKIEPPANIPTVPVFQPGLMIRWG